MTNLAFNNLILIISAFMITPSLAYAQPPNVYELKGDNLQITYSTTSFTGRPFLDYDDGSKIRSFSGDEIRTVGTEIGTLVSVTIRKTVNSGSTTFTVLIPKINLDSTKQQNIQTEGIITKHKFSNNPTLNVGQLDSYKFTLMKGTASLRYY